MGKIRRKYDPEFKEKVARQLINKELSYSQARQQYQVSNGSLSLWVENVRGHRPFKAAINHREKLLEKENLKLKEKLAELYLEVEALKKMEDYARRLKSENSYTITSRSLGQSNGGVK